MTLTSPSVASFWRGALAGELRRPTSPLKKLVASRGKMNTFVVRTVAHSSRRFMSPTSTNTEAATQNAVTNDSPSLETTATTSSSSSSNPSSPSLLTHDDLSRIRCSRLSKLFLPYLSSLPSRGTVLDDSKNFRLLVNNGFLFPSQQGMYHLLPLGVRVLDKLKRIIVEELEDAGCQELAMSSLTPSRLWERSGRWQDAGSELFRLQDRRNTELCLAPTCEENITAMIGEIRKHISFKHLPIKLFQINTKYRDEMEAKNGLLRGREFMMKDLYTFDKDVASSTSTYSIISSAYSRIFSRLALPVYRVAGSPGKIGGSLSHEFQLPSAAGEDDIIVCENCKDGVNEELLESEEERAAWRCGCEEPKILRTPAIELGHTFLLGLKYSTPFNATYRSDEGKDVLIEMGCYGIGVSRLIAACAEVSDPISKSLVELNWPKAIAPFTVGIIPPKRGSKEETPEAVDAFVQLTAKLSELFPTSLSTSSKSDVLVDDRTEFTIGRRMTDLKRVGVPFIVVVGGKFKTSGLYEVVDVSHGKTEFLNASELTNFFESLRN